MPGVAQDAIALGAQRRDHKCRTRADVRDGELGSAETCRAVHDCMQAALDSDAGAHLGELAHMLEAVLVDVLRDHALAIGLRHERHVLSLEVGRKTGKRPGRHVDRLQRRLPVPRDAKPSVARLDAGTGLLELEQQELQVLRPCALDQQLAADGGCRDGVRPRLQVVRDHRVLGAAEVDRPVHDQPLGADAIDLGAHLGQETAQVLHVWLPGGIEDLGLAVRGHRGQEDVFRPGHRREVEHDATAAQPVRGGDDLIVRLVDVGAHLAQGSEVLLDPTRPDVVAAWPGHPRVAEARDEGSEQDDRRRMRRPRSSGTSVLPAAPASMTTVPSPEVWPPSSEMISPISTVSVTRGTFCRVTGSVVSSAAAISGSAAFLEPLTQILPASCSPPVMCSARSRPPMDPFIERLRLGGKLYPRRVLARRNRASAMARAFWNSVSSEAVKVPASFSCARRRASSACWTDISSACSATSARTVTRSGRTSRNPPPTKSSSSLPPCRIFRAPGFRIVIRGACRGRMPSSPSAPFATTKSTSPSNRLRSTLTTRRENGTYLDSFFLISSAWARASSIVPTM